MEKREQISGKLSKKQKLLVQRVKELAEKEDIDLVIRPAHFIGNDLPEFLQRLREYEEESRKTSIWVGKAGYCRQQLEYNSNN